MTHPGLDLLERRVREASELVASLRARIAELEERLEEVESSQPAPAVPAEAATDAEAAWREDRRVIHERVRQLIERLERLAEG